MVLSRRERFVLVATIAAMAIFLLDRYVLTPVLEGWGALETRKDRLTGEMQRAESLMKRSRIVGKKWRQMLQEGMKQDPAEAESQVLHAVRDWSAEAGLKLSSLRPERPTGQSALPEAWVHATGTGPMRAVSRFLWRVETSKFPLRIKSMELNSRKEGQDDLQLQVRLSTLYTASRPEPAGSGGRAAPSGGDL